MRILSSVQQDLPYWSTGAKARQPHLPHGPDRATVASSRDDSGWIGAASGSRVGGGEVAPDLVLISGVRGGHRGGAQGLQRVLVLSTKTMRKPTRGGAFASWSVRTVDGPRDAHFHR